MIFVMIVATLLAIISMSSSYQMLSYKVSIGAHHITNTAVTNVNVTAPTLRYALIACHGRSNCEIVCPVDETLYTFSSLYVIGGAIDATEGEKLDCYTTRQIMLFPTVGTSLWDSKGPPASDALLNVADGIYNGDRGSCYHGKIGPYEYILVELTQISPVSVVKMRSQPSGHIASKLVEVEVRVGNESVADDFSSYSLLATYQGPPRYNTDVAFQSRHPVWGKFVSVKTVDSSSMIQICTLEIY